MKSKNKIDIIVKNREGRVFSAKDQELGQGVISLTEMLSNKLTMNPISEKQRQEVLLLLTKGEVLLAYTLLTRVLLG